MHGVAEGDCSPTTGIDELATWPDEIRHLAEASCAPLSLVARACILSLSSEARSSPRLPTARRAALRASTCGPRLRRSPGPWLKSLLAGDPRKAPAQGWALGRAPLGRISRGASTPRTRSRLLLPAMRRPEVAPRDLHVPLGDCRKWSESSSEICSAPGCDRVMYVHAH